MHTGGLPTDPDYAKLYGTENTPLKVGNLLYTCTAKNVIVALDAATGKPVWRVDPQVPDKWIPYTTACRGLAYYQMPGAAAGTPCAGRIIEGTLDSRLIAVDALTGQACTDFNGTGQQDTKIGMGPVFPGYASINSAPTIVRGIIVVPHQILDGQCRCSPSGVIQGFDAKTGKLAWAWDVEHPEWNGYPPAGQTWAKATPNSWMSSAGDEKLGLVYLPMGNVAADYISTGRTPRSNQVSSSIVALDVTTGKPRWVFQTVKKDVWDYDIGSQPSLIDYQRHAGAAGRVEAGRPLCARPRDREVAGADRLGRRAAGRGRAGRARADARSSRCGTRCKKPDLIESDMWGMSPIDQMICRIQFRQRRLSRRVHAAARRQIYRRISGL